MSSEQKEAREKHLYHKRVVEGYPLVDKMFDNFDNDIIRKETIDEILSHQTIDETKSIIVQWYATKPKVRKLVKEFIKKYKL